MERGLAEIGTVARMGQGLTARGEKSTVVLARGLSALLCGAWNERGLMKRAGEKLSYPRPYAQSFWEIGAGVALHRKERTTHHGQGMKVIKSPQDWHFMLRLHNHKTKLKIHLFFFPFCLFFLLETCLEFLVLLPPSLRCWVYRHIPSHPTPNVQFWIANHLFKWFILLYWILGGRGRGSFTIKLRLALN